MGRRRHGPLHGAPEALANLKKYDFPASQTTFDAAFNSKGLSLVHPPAQKQHNAKESP